MVSTWNNLSLPKSNVRLAPDENCIYFNATNHKIIFDTYEGIPQNLILNFVEWLILITIFTILRKSAGNYGRIALVQRPDDSLRWTQLFYGSLDEVAAAQTETASTTSVDSVYYYDSGVLSWVSAIFRIRMEDIVQKCGPNAKQYLSFQRHIICFMFIMMCTSICIILPVNFQGNLEGDETNFGHTTINNLDPNSNLLWTHVILGILYLPLAIFIMRRFSVEAKIQEKGVTESVSVMILNIPRRSCDTADLHRHFREAYPELVVKEIQLAFDITGVSKLDKEREKVYHARQYCEEYHRRTRDRMLMRPYACGYICGCCDIFGCAKVDAIEFYQAEEERLIDAIDSARTAALKRPLGIAFITFETVDDAKSFMFDFRTGCFCPGNLKNSSLSQQLQPHWWKVSYAPARSDILWENLSMPLKYWYIRAFLINILLFIFLFFLTTPAYIMNLVYMVPIKDAIVKVDPILAQYFPTLILWSVAAFLPAVVSFTDRWLGHWTRSEQNHSIMLKTFILLFFMVLVLPAIGLTSAKAFVDWTWHMKNETYRWECLSLPDKGAFFVNYVMTSSFIGTAFELLRLSELFFYGIRLCLTRSRAELSSVQKEVLWDFPFGIQYGWMLLIFSMTTMFSLFCPLITPFGLLYMLLKHAVDKHNLYFAYSPSNIGSEIHATAISCVIFSVVLVQASFFTLSFFRTGFSAVTVIALVGFSVTIFFFVVTVFFSCCKGFNPISYERRHGSSHTSPARTGDSRWFVPDVLNVQSVGPHGDEDVTRSYGTQDEPTRVLLHVNQTLYQEDSAGV